MRRFLSFLVIYAIVMFTLHLWLDYDYPAEVEAQSGRTFYIDFSSGSNSQDGTEKTHTTGITGPWKSAPGMPTASGCTTTGSGPSYTHQAGDQFIFKGGDTWPAACFGLFLPGSGTAASPIYYGTCGGQSTQPAACGGVTWPSSGWTRPLWDMQLILKDPVISAINIDYFTFDDIEIANQGVLSSVSIGANEYACALFEHSDGTSDRGVLWENMYVHDWAAVSGNVVFQSQNYAFGGIYATNEGMSGGVTVDHSTFSDANGYFLNSSGTRVNAPVGGGCNGCSVVQYSTYHDVAVGCFATRVCHDNALYNFNGTIGDIGYDTNLHSQVIEDDDQRGGTLVYNNLLHDNNTGVSMLLCDGDFVFNNVGWNNQNQGNGLIDIDSGCGSSGQPTYVDNNTLDCSNTAAPICIRIGVHGTPITGKLNIQNNIYVTNGTPVTQNVTVSNPNFTNNRTMPTSEANQYGFVSSNKYKPSSSDPAVTGAGLNLSSSCVGGLAALCLDTSGAPWFGGSYITRPTGSTGWDLGAFMGQGGTTGPPTLSINTPTSGTVSGSQNLTATCTPQGTATCTSVQYSIDGFTFGAAQTTSPYTLVWNTGTAANANHVISAVATDSNGNTGSASSTVTVTVSNSIPGCFVSNSNFSSNQSFTPQTSGTQTYTFTVTPNTAGNAGDTAQDTPIGLSQVAATGYSQFAAIVRASTNNVWDAYDGSVPGYHALNSAPYTPGTAYSFSMTVNLSASPQTYSLSETSPSSIVIATNFQLRVAVTSLGFINANSSNNSTPDTVKVCGFQAGSGTSLSFNPPSLNFGNVNSGSNASLSVTVTSANGSTSFTSVTVAGTGFTKTADTCSTNTVASCSFTIQFAPSSTGNFNGTATLVDSATGSPQAVNLSGTGTATASSATPSPTSLNFGNVQLGLAGGATSGPITVTLMNGPVTFAATPITFNNLDFSVAANTCVGSVSAPSCQITPRFVPSSLSNEIATMTVHDDAPTGGSTQTVALTGTGVNFPVVNPAVNFVWNGTLPIQVTVKGKTYSLPYPETCNCQWDNSKWSCACN